MATIPEATSIAANGPDHCSSSAESSPVSPLSDWQKIPVHVLVHFGTAKTCTTVPQYASQ